MTGVVNALLDSPSSVSIFYQDAATTLALVVVAQWWVPARLFEPDEEPQAATQEGSGGGRSRGESGGGACAQFCKLPALITPLRLSVAWLSVRAVCAGAFCDAALALFFAMAVAMGFAYAAVDTYLFLRLKELGGDGYVMGTAAVVQIISELPCFWWRCVA